MNAVASNIEIAHQIGAGGSSPKVAILLCTMNGQRYIEEQLESIERQTHPNWAVYFSDDGSWDGTLAILKRFQEKVGNERAEIHSGPAQGVASNFLSLTRKVGNYADYYAYADQDDIWESDKLSRAVQWLQDVPPEVPAIYCSRTRLVNKDGETIGYSPLFPKPPGFTNALVQNIGGGNTMVFNEAARILIVQISEAAQVVVHDWWAYMVVTGCGGQVFYDPMPTIRYRQHGSNLIGSGAGWLDWASKARSLLGGRYKTWSDINIAALRQIRPSLTSENRRHLDEFAEARAQSLWKRLRRMRRIGLYRQTLMGNLSLIVSILLNRL